MGSGRTGIHDLHYQEIAMRQEWEVAELVTRLASAFNSRDAAALAVLYTEGATLLPPGSDRDVWCTRTSPYFLDVAGFLGWQLA